MQQCPCEQCLAWKYVAFSLSSSESDMETELMVNDDIVVKDQERNFHGAGF